MQRFRWVALIAVLMAASCGYHFSGEGPGPQPGLRRVAIPVFENNTSEPELGAIFASALRKEFLMRGDILVVPLEEAEAVFRGKVSYIAASPVAHRAADDTIQERLYVTLDIRCEDVRNGTVIWQDPHFTYYKTFLQNVDPMITFDNRRSALEYLAREMAMRIHDRFLTNF